METKDNIKSGTFENIKRVFQKSKPDFTAEYAWLETTYGAGTFRSLEQRIKEKQDFIRNLITYYIIFDFFKITNFISKFFQHPIIIFIRNF